MLRTFFVAVAFALFAVAPTARAVVSTELDTFQDGTTEGWTGGSSPTNNATGGPAGLGDRYLRLTANFTNMASYNPTQWAGNYTAAGITDIEADLMTVPGSDPGSIRLVIFGPTLSRWTSVTAVSVPADGVWRHFVFSLRPADMVNVLSTTDTYAGTLAAADRLMFRHDVDAPTAGGTPYTGSIGIDNVKAITVPEPACIALLAPLGLILRPPTPITSADMDKVITGRAYVLGDNIDTDQIIPAIYLKFSTTDPEERKFFGMYALSSVPEGQRGLRGPGDDTGGNIPFVRENEFTSDYQIVVGGKNFGSGSSREHAPLALAEAGVKCVIAEFYARIFFRNSVNGGYLVPFESQERLVEKVRTGDELEVHMDEQYVLNKTQNVRYPLKPLGDVLPIIEAGGVFDYAKKTGMLK